MVKLNLPYLMEKFKVTQKEVSEVTGISKNTINRYYNNTWTTINKEHIEQLCNCFDCKIDVLFTVDYKNNVDPNQIDMFNKIEDSIKEQEFKQSLKKTRLGHISQEDGEPTYVNFFDYIQDKMGSLTEQEIHTYAILLGESPHQAEYSYSDTVKMIRNINEQYKPK